MSARKLQQLVLLRSSQAENIYGRFTAEILRNEGYAGFQIVDLDRNSMRLQKGDLAVLTRCFLTMAQMDALVEQVCRGAALVCLQPSPALAARFGWRATSRVQYPGWVYWKGVSWLDRSIQAHVPIAGYTPSAKPGTCEVVAEAVQPNGVATGFPAVIRQSFGKGQAVLFFYDPAAAIARIRFGNPDLASLSTNGIFAFPHAADLFEHHLDPNAMHLPQADLHAQMLAAAVSDISPYPLPRLWYYPRVQQRSAAVFQSDDDWSSPEEFDALTRALEKRGATGTFYLMQDSRLDPQRMTAMRKAGHTFGPHVNHKSLPDEAYFSYPQALARETELFDRRHGGHSATLQAHCAPWMGHMAWVPLHLRHAYRMLFAYISLPLQRYNRYMCGSGRPARFFDTSGVLYNCWQQPIIAYDDASLKEYLSVDPRAALQDFSALLHSALNNHHTAFGILSHPVSFCSYSRPYMEGIFDLMHESGAPIFNGDEWLNFLERRHAVVLLHEIDGNSIRCRITGAHGEMTLLIPEDNRGESTDRTTNVQRFGRPYRAVQIEGNGSDKYLEIRQPGGVTA